MSKSDGIDDKLDPFSLFSSDSGYKILPLDIYHKVFKLLNQYSSVHGLGHFNMDSSFVYNKYNIEGLETMYDIGIKDDNNMLISNYKMQCNYKNNNNKLINMKKQFVFWWGGIVRGAICFALSLRKETPHSPIIITTTFAIVIATTFVVGSLTETFLICIGLKDPNLTAEKANNHRKSTHILEYSTFKRFLLNIDEKYIKPIFGGRYRRLHEMSIDNSEFEYHYQQYQNKQIQKAVSSTRL
eukprot:478694_1